MHVRRTAVGAALVLPLTLAGLAPAVALAAPRTAGAPAATAPTTGRLITSDKPGIVLVDETGKRSEVLVDVRRKDDADLAEINPNTGVFLWSTGSGSKKWHISNLYGAQLGDFTVPAGSSEPSIDSGGYEYWWVAPGSGTSPAVVKSFEINNPLAEVKSVRELSPGSATGIELSPDDQWLATEVTGASGTTLHVASTDGKIDRVVPVPTGSHLVSSRVVFSPDSGRVAFLAVQDGVVGAVPSVYVAPIAGDYAPIKLAATTTELYDWSPDGATILTKTVTAGAPTEASARLLTGVSATTGATVASYNIKHHPDDAGVFWSGLPAGAFPRDKIQPKLGIAQPKCGVRKASACESYRHTTAAWRTIRGPVVDKGRSQLRYVAVAVFQKRASGWWALVGNGKHPTWKKFPNYVEARYTAKERTAQIKGKNFRIKVPGLQAGKLYVVAKARDGAENNTAVKYQVQLR